MPAVTDVLKPRRVRAFDLRKNCQICRHQGLNGTRRFRIESHFPWQTRPIQRRHHRRAKLTMRLGCQRQRPPRPRRPRRCPIPPHWLDHQSLAIGINVIFADKENIALPFHKRLLQTKRPRRQHLKSHPRILGEKKLQDPWDTGINGVMWDPRTSARS